LQDVLTGNQDVDGEAHFLMAEILHEAGSYSEAERHYRYALEINPDEPRYYIRQIKLYDSWRGSILHEAMEKYPDVEVFKKLAERDRDI
jgi:tetratricopeptide (TPR) repeat protein